MAFVRKKKIKGHEYAYLVENYRCPDTGKRKQRVLNYLGRVEEEPKVGIEEGKLIESAMLPPVAAPIIQEQKPLPAYLPGDWVWFKYICDHLYRGQVIEPPSIRNRRDCPLVEFTHLRFFLGGWCESAIPLDRIIGRDYPLGSWVEFDGEMDGQTLTHSGVVVQTTTQVPACPWPRQKRRSGVEAIRVPIVIPAVVSVRYSWLGTPYDIQLPVAQVRPKLAPELAGHQKRSDRIQGGLF